VPPTRWLAVLVAATALLATGCGPARPTLAQLRAQPVLEIPPGSVLLLRVGVKPRKGGLGTSGRDGAAEVVTASDDPPAVVAARLMAGYGSRFGLQRVDNTAGGAVVGSELRGRDPASGALVQINVTSGKPFTLYGGPDDLRPPPPTSRSFTSVAVISRQH
jgi:hypothetical protein